MNFAIALVIVLMTSFGVGAGVIALAGRSPRLAGAAAELWALYRSEVLIVFALLIPAIVGDWVFLAVLTAFVWRGQFELFNLFDVSPWGKAEVAAMLVATALMGAGYWALGGVMTAALAVSVVAVAVVGLIFETSNARAATAASMLSLVFPALLASCVMALRMHENGLAWIVVVYGTVEINDATALVAGKLFGRRRILPNLSPGKTGAGLLAGLVTGFAAGFLLALFLLDLPPFDALRIVALTLAAGVVGDILTSMLKRWRGKKDFPSVLAAHGGVLDIYDSFLLAGPLVFLLRDIVLV